MPPRGEFEFLFSSFSRNNKEIGILFLFLGDITVCAQDVAEGIGFQFQQKKRMWKEGPRHFFIPNERVGKLFVLSRFLKLKSFCRLELDHCPFYLRWMYFGNVGKKGFDFFKKSQDQTLKKFLGVGISLLWEKEEKNKFFRAQRQKSIQRYNKRGGFSVLKVSQRKIGQSCFARILQYIVDYTMGNIFWKKFHHPRDSFGNCLPALSKTDDIDYWTLCYNILSFTKTWILFFAELVNEFRGETKFCKN